MIPSVQDLLWLRLAIPCSIRRRVVRKINSSDNLGKTLHDLHVYGKSVTLLSLVVLVVELSVGDEKRREGKHTPADLVRAISKYLSRGNMNFDKFLEEFRQALRNKLAEENKES